jgi:hypothetical protein
VHLAPEEKQFARVRAYHELVELIRGMPNPPVRVPRADAVADADGDGPAPLPRLLRAIEVAYNLCPRPSSVVIAELGAFAGGLGVLEPAAVDAQRRRQRCGPPDGRDPSPSRR